ncbi:uncharacterized protein LOC125384260 [Haliotis rufescens]|uniref:uncharacterized protein LOC125384260 n=1 Tax=Haliotis rufescens TaxID=6454 RepID=UPI00201F68BF|nr:uncharacterized protein LOC125384260 [Haliotis rufescens]XP_048258969.1 uncharacterized protein LOC125384260 [Haliotis rufescens]
MSPFTQYFRYREVTVSNDDLLSEEEYSVDLKELQAEWEKAKPSNTHIKLLRQYRKRWMTSLPDGTIQPIIEAYPFFSEGQHVLSEFFAIVYPEKEEEQARQDVCQKVEWLLRHKDDITEVDLLVDMEKAVAVEKGRAKKSKSIISVHKVDGVASVKEAFF